MEHTNQINLSQVSEIELKAFAYDELSKIDVSQANLRLINQELTTRAKAVSATLNKGAMNQDLQAAR